jgi:hypothetical protein
VGEQRGFRHTQMLCLSDVAARASLLYVIDSGFGLSDRLIPSGINLSPRS